MQSTPDHYPITLPELLAILAKQLGRKIPIIGDVIDAHDEVMGEVEARRLSKFLEELEGRVSSVEDRFLKTPLGHPLLASTAQSVRTDLREGKSIYYANLLVSFARNAQNEAVNEAAEALEGV